MGNLLVFFNIDSIKNVRSKNNGCPGRSTRMLYRGKTTPVMERLHRLTRRRLCPRNSRRRLAVCTGDCDYSRMMNKATSCDCSSSSSEPPETPGNSQGDQE